MAGKCQNLAGLATPMPRSMMASMSVKIAVLAPIRKRQ
jgi:hypothetical protein